jgi:hypothetical protein
MKRSVIIGLVVVLAGLLFVPVSFLWVGWWTIGKPLRDAVDRERDFLLHKADHRAVAGACLEMMTNAQYSSLHSEHPSGDDARLPEAIRNLKSFWLTVSTNEVTIFQTGGHYHMGFAFGRHAAASNRLALVFFEEDKLGHKVILYALPESQ